MTEHPEPLTFFIEGTPIPQGSKTAIRHGRRARLIEANKRLKPWRNTNGEGIHAVKPDVDKLTRAVLDSLTAADIIDDDARCATLTATKNYTTKRHPTPGVRITIIPNND